MLWPLLAPWLDGDGRGAMDIVRGGGQAKRHEGIRGKVEDDVYSVYERWADRSAAYTRRARREFERAVDPLAFHLERPSLRSLMCVNLAFTEWFLFEFRLSGGLTPVEMTAGHPPAEMPVDRCLRLGEVARTQFFSLFAIREKLPESGEVRLLDLRGGGEYLVQAGELCRMRNWRRGAVMLRIARVGGQWIYVGRTLFYDRAPVAATRLLPELGCNAGVLAGERLAGWGDAGAPAAEGWAEHGGACKPAAEGPAGCGGAGEPAAGCPGGNDGAGNLAARQPPAAASNDESFYLRFLHETIGNSGSFSDTFRIVA